MELCRVLSKEALYRLKPGCRVDKPENREPDIGKKFIIRSPFSATDYHTEVYWYTQWDVLDEYIRAGNVYVL